MFNYDEFKAEMMRRGHTVHKKGKMIVINPDNNYLGYAKGFLCAQKIIEGYEEYLQYKKMNHFNTWIYSASFKIL